jgi:hypothetical protein
MMTLDYKSTVSIHDSLDSYTELEKLACRMYVIMSFLERCLGAPFD